MRRIIAMLVAATLTGVLVPQAGGAAPACGVLFDPSGDVVGPLGLPRPAEHAGRAIDITSTSMTSTAQSLIVSLAIADLAADATDGTSGAFYTVFFSSGTDRYFAQAARAAAADGWSFSAGRAADLEDTVPQHGIPVSGSAVSKAGIVRIVVPRGIIGAPVPGTMLQQIRARTIESAWTPSEPRVVHDEAEKVLEIPRRNGQSDETIAATNDHAGGLDGGRFLMDKACVAGISAAGQRCVVVDGERPNDATGGSLPDAAKGSDVEGSTRNAPAGPVDPATEIRSLQMGSNDGTIVVEVGVADLSKPIPSGADAQRWDVTWMLGDRTIGAFAERRSGGTTFGYVMGGIESPTTGSLDTAGGAVRILVPRYEIGAASRTMLTTVRARSSLVFGGMLDPRDAAPDKARFDTKFVVGASCAEQEKAACPVLLDPAGDGAVADEALDVTAAGVSAPDGSMVFSIRVEDLGAPVPDGFDTQGWTVVWNSQEWRFMAQVMRKDKHIEGFTAYLGPAQPGADPAIAQFPHKESRRAFTPTLDEVTGTIRMTIPRGDVGLPGNGLLITDVGVGTFLLSHGEPADDVYTPARQPVAVDLTPTASYRVGLFCGA